MNSYAVRLDPSAGAPAAGSAGESYQDAILPGVSRTFALTIPELPRGLREVVTNGYLLCRIADTIEDDPALSLAERRLFHARFHAAVAGEGDAEALALELAPRLSDRTLAAERELVRNAAEVVRVTHGFAPRERAALSRCVGVMCEGMPRFQRGGRPRGLADVDELHEYCYYVAGVVGEMLTELFCAHSPRIDARRAELERLCVSFGQGLQMTNILKDVWDDLERGFCWLPRDVFVRAGFDLSTLAPGRRSPEFQRGLRELIGIAHGHLRDALEYTLLLPKDEKGIRRFCLWALGMAVLTLKKIHRRIDFDASRQVKISRRSVKAAIAVSNACTSSDALLRFAFALSAAGLPAATFVDAREKRALDRDPLAAPAFERGALAADAVDRDARAKESMRSDSQA
jgi:farnesyl-diphosphate farnesyltransferase